MSVCVCADCEAEYRAGLEMVVQHLHLNLDVRRVPLSVVLVYAERLADMHRRDDMRPGQAVTALVDFTCDLLMSHLASQLTSESA